MLNSKSRFAAVMLAAAVAACAGSPAKESTGEYIDDSTITTKVKTALLSDSVSQGMNIKVDTFKGTVQLSGFADSAAEIERAVQVASKVAGVKAVNNDIHLKPGK